MQIEKLYWSASEGWQKLHDMADADLVLYFGSRETLAAAPHYAELKDLFPSARIVGCSSASQISGDEIIEDGISGVAVKLTTAKIQAESVSVTGPHQSAEAGEKLGRLLSAPDLAAILVLSDGLSVNGSELTRGMSRHIPSGVPVSGGLAADGPLFERTLVGLDGEPVVGQIAAVGFYGSSLSVTTGSAGGWTPFGPRRRISRSSGSVLYELDGEPALDLYERYLGADLANSLPSSALLYPLNVIDPAHPDHRVVRTVLSIDREAHSMTFAGDVPEGWIAQLMRGNADKLALGAAEAARQVRAGGSAITAETLILLVSCFGRRLLMGSRTIDEVHAVNAELGADAIGLGFYSYGEICPHDSSGRGEMHNQTMTITAISEAA